jgi:hypothetical protein
MKSDDMVRLQAGVCIYSPSQLHAAFVASGEDSVFQWLEKMAQKKPLLIASDKGLWMAIVPPKEEDS